LTDSVSVDVEKTPDGTTPGRPDDTTGVERDPIPDFLPARTGNEKRTRSPWLIVGS
jgi:hypothetical protein